VVEHCDHILLPDTQRETLIASVAAAIEDVGGAGVTYRYWTLLLIAHPAV
jgi:hypothetical protein